MNLPENKEAYSQVLAKLSEEIRVFYAANALSEAQLTEERQAVLIAASTVQSERFCFLSVPADLLTLYRENVFPIVKEVGLEPITSDSFINK